MNQMVLAFGKRVSAAFIDRLFAMCRRNGWTLEYANWLMACIAFETGGTFSPSIKNMAGSGATGLIQFMPLTALGLFYSNAEISRMDRETKRTLGRECCEKLAKMTDVEQLQYVEAYFKPYAKRISCLEDMYMAILMPSYIGKPNDSALFTDGTVAYRQNSGLDKDKDGKVTKAEAAGKVRAQLLRGLEGPNVLTGIPGIS